ncbi:MAG TPA: SpoIIE family protein phosphatase, partial [Bacteroidia bacterium]|nr:SpoIIE family protein phosphatase [Bacteroidia bacterium]
AGVFQEQKNYDSSILYLKKMIKLSEDSHDTTSMADAYGNLGAVYLEMGDTANSLPYCLLGAKYAELTGYNYQLLTSSGNLGQIYLMEKNYDESERYLMKAEALAEELQSPENRSANYKMLAKLYEAKGDSGLANRYLNRYTDLRDSMINESRMKQMTDLEAKYQSTKKDKELLEERTASEKKTLLVYSLSIGLTLVIALAFFAWRGYVNKKRLSEEIHKQKEIIELKSHEILDSIHYAERIQRAILPPPEVFSSFFGECFLLYIPKDIVSGDFYWIYREAKTVLIGVGDCTGHGVPGAFMSMLGIDKLNEIVKSSLDPGEILMKLNRSVKATLHQAELENEALPPVRESNVQDGMDMVILAIDTEKNSMTYAGANRPAWICRGGKEWIEFKPTKVSIGGYTTDDQQFGLQQFSLQKNDTIYLCTDGFADQFGGEEGKKIMTKRFREWLAGVQHLPMEKQREELQSRFLNWKGDVEQVDDVLLIGIKI